MSLFSVTYIGNLLSLDELNRVLYFFIPTHQLGPRYEGQLMSDGGAYSPFRSILLVLTHDFIIIMCLYQGWG